MFRQILVKAPSEQDLKDILIAACEGGSNYWARVKDYNPDAGTVTLIDCGDESRPNTKFPVTTQTIQKGLDLMLKSDKSHFRKWAVSDPEDIDADISDVIVQMGLFGEVIYG